jgi:hypothetical protein
VSKPDISQSNPYYPGNRPPLLASPFIRLPTGTVKPQGWMRKQLELQAEGFIGHMSEVSGFLNKNDNAWLKPDGKGGCFWEEVPYLTAPNQSNSSTHGPVISPMTTGAFGTLNSLRSRGRRRVQSQGRPRQALLAIHHAPRRRRPE